MGLFAANPINVEAVVQTLQLKLFRNNGNEQIFICPFCSHEKEWPKLYLNVQKMAFICHHCHTSGSITDLWAMLTNTDTKTAYKQMLNLESVTIPQRKPMEIAQRKKPQASVEKLHQVYSEFLNKLSLSKEHREDLVRRGLPAGYINYFRSLPEEKHTRWRICSNLAKKYNLDDVPGFIKKVSRLNKPYWDCINSGMLVPVRNIKGKITSCQVRTGGNPKYIFFSYAGQLKSSAHIIPGEGTPWIIEGILKSYVVHSFLKVPCIGIPGTNTYKTIPTGLLRGGRVVLAYDIEENPYTAEAKRKAIQFLEENGLKVICASWNPDLGKGIDDACLTLKNQGIKLTPEIFIPGI